MPFLNDLASESELAKYTRFSRKNFYSVPNAAIAAPNLAARLSLGKQTRR
jgi:hypothetical protein